MRVSSLIALALAAAAMPAMSTPLADDINLSRRELYEVIARAAPPANQQGSQAFGLFSLVGDGLKGLGDLIEDKSNNKKSREFHEDYEHPMHHYGGEHRFHGHEREHERFHRPGGHFREHEHERFHRPGRFREHEQEHERYHRPEHFRYQREVAAQQQAPEHTYQHQHQHQHPHQHQHQHKYQHPWTNAGGMQHYTPSQHGVQDFHRAQARELVDLITREAAQADDQSQALSLGSLFKVGSKIFHVFDHGNSSRRALPEEY